MSFDPSQFIGKFGAFYLTADAVDRCAILPGAKRHVGECIGAKPCEPSRGIPSALLTFRGRSGRVATVNRTDCYVQLFGSWSEALANAALPNTETCHGEDGPNTKTK